MVDNEVIRMINGSTLYGLNHETSDEDYVVIFMEPPEVVFSNRKIHSVNLEPEVDGVGYSLRHFVQLALDGNPSVLTVLHAPIERAKAVTWFPVWKIFALKGGFTSMRAAPRFLGYMNNQRERLGGTRTGHIPNRPELVEKYGYDTKYAMQALRLGMQGVEYFSTGTISSPMETNLIELLKDVRFGKYSYEQVMSLVLETEEALIEAIAKNALPPEPDEKMIYTYVRELHEDWWSKGEHHG